MERTLTYSISPKEEGMTIQAFLKSKGYSSQNIVELKKMPESILLNGVWEYVTHKLYVNDVLTVHIQENAISEKIPPVNLPLTIVYEDEDLMVIDKPYGMPVHPSMDNYYNTMANGLAWYFKEQNIPFVFRCINRLDKDTSGLTLVAKHMLSANILSSMISEKGNAYLGKTAEEIWAPSLPANSILREYLTIVQGEVSPVTGTISAPIARKDASVILRCVDFEKGSHAVTHYKVLDQKNGYSLLAVKLETGRTHQIRVHMNYIGHPLIGDSLYNEQPGVLSRQALHSHKLCFPHPITGKYMEFISPLPADLENLLIIKNQT